MAVEKHIGRTGKFGLFRCNTDTNPAEFRMNRTNIWNCQHNPCKRDKYNYYNYYNLGTNYYNNRLGSTGCPVCCRMNHTNIGSFPNIAGMNDKSRHWLQLNQKRQTALKMRQKIEKLILLFYS